MTAREIIQLTKFFTLLAVKEHLAPRLHVRPLVAELFLTENCNLRCVSCACWRDKTRAELSTAEWENVLTQLADLGIYKANFTGGEPLLRKDAVALINFARKSGIPHAHLNTNGILLTPVKLGALLDVGVRSFNISIDGTQVVHDEIRGRRGAFDRTIAHLRNLIQARAQYGLKIRMNFTVMRDNVHILPQVVALAQELGVRLYLNLATDQTFLFRDKSVERQTRLEEAELNEALRSVETIARMSSQWLPRYSDLRYVSRHFSDRVQRTVPCAESQLKLMIHSQGQVGGCWGHDPTSNVRTTPIAEIIDAREYRDEHARLFRKDCVGCGSNYSLNLRWRPVTYLHDVLWKLGLRTLARP